MNIRNLNIKDASSAALEALMNDISIELQERQLRVNCEDALNHHLLVSEVSEEYREAYAAYLETRSDLQLATSILSEWHSEQDRKQTMKTTGA